MALPVIFGAALLKAERLRQRGLAPGAAAPLVAGVAASFGSTLASERVIRALERDRTLVPYAAYRIALAAAVLRRLTDRPTTMAP
jgi:undecaprenyl pyrophosphate phosphatase UppP